MVPAEVAALQAENAQLRQALAQAQQVMHERAEPVLLAAMDALDTLCRMAEAGHPPARELVARWNRVQQRAQGATTALTVVRNGASTAH